MAQATMAAIAGLKETYVQLKTRMDKAVEDFRKAMAAVLRRPAAHSAG